MRYVSTRGRMSADMDALPFSAILLEGLATDGGLALPAHYPRFDANELAAMRTMNYADLAFAVLSRYMDDIPAADLRRIIARTYTSEVFGSAEITPLSTLAPGLSLLHLSNGPTLAFKDVALQLLGNLFEYVLEREQRRINILGATSGDTGSSAEYALRGKERVSVFMLSPWARMSPFQQAQMYSLDDPRIFNIAIDGTFDTCQDIVKAVTSDAAFKARYQIGAVNSINWARVAAQVVYYFRGYFAATAANGQPVDFAVPSGNFGNILAGYVAREMGLPIRRLILATNENDVLDEFFRTGRYRPRAAAQTHATSSPSMDISKASNFERFVYDVVGRSPDVVRALMAQVQSGHGFDLAGTPYWERVKAAGFVSGSSTHADRMATIRDVAQRYAVVIDPHTADGVYVARQFIDADVPMVCLETALPAKFSASIREALGREPARDAAFANLEDAPQHAIRMGPDVAQVSAFIAAHATT